MHLRRLLTIPAVLGFTLLWSLLLPVWAPLAGLYDQFSNRKLAVFRALTVALAYGWAESVGLYRATRIGRDPAANYALQRQWALGLWRMAVALYGLRVHMDGAESLRPGPVLLLLRHTSLADTVLPVVLLAPSKAKPRYVLKRELLIDPCLDVVGHRVPNAFIRREGDTQNALAAVSALADGLGPDDAIVLYPEGTRFTPERRARAIARGKPGASALRNVLPAASGGVLAVLGKRKIDVVFCAHLGLEGAATARDLVRGTLVNREVRLKLWRVAAAEIPDTAEGQAVWLDAAWARMDAEVEALKQAGQAGGTPE